MDFTAKLTGILANIFIKEKERSKDMNYFIENDRFRILEDTIDKNGLTIPGLRKLINKYRNTHNIQLYIDSRDKLSGLFRSYIKTRYKARPKWTDGRFTIWEIAKNDD